LLITWLAVTVIFLGSFAYGRLTFSGTTEVGFARLAEMPILREMSHLVRASNREVKGETEDRINVLLLGMGGEGHDGANLTDTIIVASIRPSDSQVAMLSIPRDLLVPMPDEAGWHRINYANAHGELKTPGRGGDVTRQLVEGLLGLDIPYYVRIDFNGFKDVINSVGGVDVYVERSFQDHSYPTEDYKYQTISFEEGWRHMDGDTALKYARSRKGTNGEGTDFARGKRQQKVIAALRDKVVSAHMLKNPAALTNALAALRANITTNIQLGEILRLANIGRSVDQDAIRHEVLSDRGDDAALISADYGGAYVLLPKNNDWSVVRDIAQNLFEVAEPTGLTAAPKPPEAAAADEPAELDAAKQPAAPAGGATIEIRNGSGKSGEARLIATQVKNGGFRVVKIGNADSFDYGASVVYDLTGGTRPDDLRKFVDLVNAREVKPGSPTETAGGNADFILIIGKE
jgi:LCP family protein required for cell wall assembly